MRLRAGTLLPDGGGRVLFNGTRRFDLNGSSDAMDGFRCIARRCGAYAQASLHGRMPVIALPRRNRRSPSADECFGEGATPRIAGAVRATRHASNRPALTRVHSGRLCLRRPPTSMRIWNIRMTRSSLLLLTNMRGSTSSARRRRYIAPRLGASGDATFDP